MESNREQDVALGRLLAIVRDDAKVVKEGCTDFLDGGFGHGFPTFPPPIGERERTSLLREPHTLVAKTTEPPFGGSSLFRVWALFTVCNSD
jgi:hypothetical protein